MRMTGHFAHTQRVIMLLSLFASLASAIGHGRTAGTEAAPAFTPLAPESTLPGSGGELVASGQTDQAIVPGETIRFRTTWLDGGGLHYQGTYAYSTLKRNGETLLRQSGQYTFANGNRAEEESLLVPVGKGYRPRSFKLTVTNPAGKVIRTEQLLYNPTATSVRVIRTYDDPTRQDDQGITDQVDKTIPIPPDTYPRQMFDAMLRVTEFQPGVKRSLNVITRMGDVYGIVLQADGQEELTTPAGTFQTMRVRLVPDIALLPLLMPSLTIRIWYTCSMPHLPVKFEGYPQPPPPRFQNEVRMMVTGIELPKKS